MVMEQFNSFYTVDEYICPQVIAPRGRGRVYSSSTVVCISLLLILFKVLFGSLYPHIRFCWWLSIFATCFGGLSSCFLHLWSWVFLRWQVLGLGDTLLSKPWSSLWTTIVMKKTTMGPHFFCVLCFTVSVLCIVSVLSVLSFYVCNQSACGKYISNTITYL